MMTHQIRIKKDKPKASESQEQRFYDKIETKRVICIHCGAYFYTRLAPYWTEHKI